MIKYVGIDDPIPPIIDPLEDLSIYEGQELSIKAHCTDNIGISSIVWKGLPSAWSGPHWRGTIDESGNLDILVVVQDTSGNEAAAAFVISVLPEDHDTDGDGIPDLVEIEIGLSHLDPSDAGFDMDMDGLNNLEEFLIGTYPYLKDSDNDGLPDGWEIDNGLDPFIDSDTDDPDEDGITNLEEYIGGTDPNHFDEVVERDVGDDGEDPFDIVNIILASLIIAAILVLMMFAFRRRGSS
jgi:hypothetical protein